MAGLYRRLGFIAVGLPLVFLVMSGLARATTFTVVNTNDSGTGSLRAAITSANLVPTVANTINFSVSGTITLGSTLPGIANTSPGSLTIDGSGEAITVDGAHSFQILSVISGTLKVQNLTVAHGNAGTGGGIVNEGTLTVTNSTFSGNGGGDGGGVSNHGSLTVANSTFSANSVLDFGGGISNDAGATATITNSTFSGNSATASGGGIDNEGTLTVTNSTFSGNSAGVGGDGIDDEPLGSTMLKGTILAAEPIGGNCGGLITDAGYNISDDPSCGFIQAPTPGGTSINNSTTLNLDSAGLQNNGGPTQTIALEPNSQAVDFIPVASCTVATDQRGFPRPDFANTSFCDAGAFELQTERIVLVPGSEKIQIARSTTSSDSDMVNMAFTFDDIGNPTSPACNAGTDALNGVDVDLFEGTCADLATATGGLLLDLSPFVVHTVGTETYGTLFQKSPTVPSPETVSVRIVQLAGPGGDKCGTWTLNIEVTGLDTAAIGLGGGNPFALVVEDSDKNEGCFDIDNAIVGNQITPPHAVRRGPRRGRR